MKKVSGSIIAGLLCFVLAGAITVQIRTMQKESSEASLGFASDTLKDSVLQWKEKSENAEKELEKSNKELQEIREKATTGDSASDEKRKRIDENNKLMGLTDVVGEGVIVTIQDSTTPVAAESYNSYLVHDIDLREIVSELTNSGAEAVSINGHRIVSSTCIVCAGNIISINGERINSPFVIKAIGDKESLYSITRPGSYLKLLEAATIPVEVKKENDIQIGKYNGAIPEKFIKNIEK